MKINFIFYFFKLTRFTLAIIAAVIDEKPLRNRACTVSNYKIRPTRVLRVNFYSVSSDGSTENSAVPAQQELGRTVGKLD